MKEVEKDPNLFSSTATFNAIVERSNNTFILAVTAALIGLCIIAVS